MKTVVKSLLPITVLACSMLTVRFILSDSFWHGWMYWNLFLAYLPLVFSLWIKYKNPNNTFGLLLLGITWLLFFPNAHYVITDFFHLTQKPQNIPLWYDTIMLMVFAWCGVLAGCISLSHIHEKIEQKFSSKIGWTSIVGICLLAGYGMYIGRFLRFNSWDIITNPINLLQDSLRLFFQTDIAFHFYGFSLGFAVFIFTSYWSVKYMR